MSIVMPAGNKKYDWIPKDTKSLVKTASTDSEGADVEASDNLDDSLYNAALAHAEAVEAPRDADRDEQRARPHRVAR